MDDQTLREHAQAFCDALLEGDIDKAIGSLSQELHRNLGEVIALFPLPATETSIVSIESGGSGHTIILQLVSETETVLIQTRWKDRDGTPTIVEASRLSKTPTVAADVEPEATPDEV